MCHFSYWRHLPPGHFVFRGRQPQGVGGFRLWFGFPDASNRGIGGFMDELPFGHLWVFVPLPRGTTLSWSRTTRSRGIQDPDNPESVSSGYCEAAGLLLSHLTFLPIWSAANPVRPAGAGVWAWSDSKVVVDMWAAKKACDTMLAYLHAFAHLEALYSITLIVTKSRVS